MYFHSQQPVQSEPIGSTAQNKVPLQKRREVFATQIRRSKLNEKFKTMRQDLRNERQKFEHAQNQSKNSVIFQNHHQYQYSLVDNILEKQINLIEISLKDERMKNENEQKFSSPLNSQLNPNETEKLERQPLKFHIQLYSSISHDIQLNPQKYQKMDKRKQEQLIDFWLRFLEKNKYKETAGHNQYHRTVIQFLTLFTSVIDSPDLREKILMWVEGTQSLALIFNCIPDQFMNCFKYGRIYEIILKGLTNKNLEIKSEAIDVLLKAIRMSDYDDISQLLQQKSELFTKLLKFFQNQQIIEGVSYKKQQTIQYVIKAAYCVNLFLTTYDDYVLNCLKQGAGYVGAWLICQENNMLIREGLQIFTIIAGIQDEQYREQAQSFLLTNTSINDSNVWHRLGRTYQIIGHQDSQVKNCFVTFISTFFAYSNLNKIMQLNEKFRYPHGQSLVDVLILMIKVNDEPNIILNILNALQSVLYYNWSDDQRYSEEYSQEYLELYQQDQNSFRPQIIDDFQKHVIRNKMEKSEINIKLNDLYYRQHIDQSLKDQIKIILDILEQN